LIHERLSVEKAELGRRSVPSTTGESPKRGDPEFDFSVLSENIFCKRERINCSNPLFGKRRRRRRRQHHLGAAIYPAAEISENKEFVKSRSPLEDLIKGSGLKNGQLIRVSFVS
jgi:hypothetical protein